MYRMNRLMLKILCTLLLMLNSCNTNAANWSGFYVGAQSGKARSNMQWHYENANYFNTLDDILLGTNFNQEADGGVSGVSAGYQYQLGAFIFGFEEDVLNSSLNVTTASPFFPTLDRYTTKIKNLSVFKARLGYAMSSWLFYLSGGYTSAKIQLSLIDITSNIVAQATNWFNGWNAGLGAEYRFTNHLSVGLDYQYLRLIINQQTVPCPNCGSGVGLGTPIVDARINNQMFTASLNYYFSAI